MRCLTCVKKLHLLLILLKWIVLMDPQVVRCLNYHKFTLSPDVNFWQLNSCLCVNLILGPAENVMSGWWSGWMIVEGRIKTSLNLNVMSGLSWWVDEWLWRGWSKHLETSMWWLDYLDDLDEWLWRGGSKHLETKMWWEDDLGEWMSDCWEADQNISKLASMIGDPSP